MTAHITKREKVHDPAGPLTEILEVSALPAVSLTPAPAYDDAQVISREAVAEHRAAEEAELTRLRTLLTHANQHTDR
jgi:phage head maturation protease